MFVGVNLTFFPLHFSGLQGYPRKYIDYPDVFSIWNIYSSFGRILRIFSLFLFLIILFKSFQGFGRILRDEFINVSPETGSRPRLHLAWSVSAMFRASIRWCLIHSCSDLNPLRLPSQYPAPPYHCIPSPCHRPFHISSHHRLRHHSHPLHCLNQVIPRLSKFPPPLVCPRHCRLCCLRVCRWLCHRLPPLFRLVATRCHHRLAHRISWIVRDCLLLQVRILMAEECDECNDRWINECGFRGCWGVINEGCVRSPGAHDCQRADQMDCRKMN